MSDFVYKDLTIKHSVRKNLKNCYISINNEKEILLKTPKVTQSFILELLESKERWIRKKLYEMKENEPKRVNIEDEVLLFGEIYSIDMPEASSLRKKLEKKDNYSVEKTIQHYNDFYKEYAQDYITPRVLHFSQIMGYPYSQIKYRKMKRRWGSCSSTKILTFNTELIKVKKELIDYVIVHELAHLKHMNHSKKFHDFVEKHLPSSQKYRKELKKNQIATF